MTPNASRDPINRSREDRAPRSEAIRCLVERGLSSKFDTAKPRVARKKGP
jgi:hypothetical protein